MLTSLKVEGELRAHVAGALHDYVHKLWDYQQTTPSLAAKADYQRTIDQIEQLIDHLNAED